MNVSQVKTKKQLKEEVDRVEEEKSDDYEEPDSDESHDYVEVDPADNYIMYDQNRDDEHEYVNELWRK